MISSNTAKIALIRQLFGELTSEERREVLSSVKEKRLPKVKKTHHKTLTDLLTSIKGDRPACPHCGSVHTSKWSSKAHRFVCVDCRKTFTLSSGTVFYGAKEDLRTYRKYIALMMDGTSIRKSAKACGISVHTSFLWRHKFLDTLREIMDGIKLEGVIEGDETFFSISYKGSRHLPRKAHHRGTPARKRGLSKEKVCVPCGVNREGLSVSRITNLGSVKSADLKSLFKDKVEPGSIFCADMNGSYVKFAKDTGVQLVRVKSHKRVVKGFLGIQTINSYHSGLKRFLRPFNGVATKYLNNYLLWYNFKNWGKGDEMMLMDHLCGAVSFDRSRNIQVRPAIPLCT